MKEKVLEILLRINSKAAGCDEDEDLLKAGIIDSFEIVNLIVELEDTFGISIEPDQISAPPT